MRSARVRRAKLARAKYLRGLSGPEDRPILGRRDHRPLATDSFDRVGDPRRGDLLETRGAAASASRLTRQLLAFSRKQVLQPRVVDLNAVVQAVAPMLQRLIGEHVTLATHVSSVPLRVLVDPGVRSWPRSRSPRDGSRCG